MSIFKEHKSSADRSATDRRRHKEKIERAIKDGIHDIVAEESIIGQDGKKRIKIPVAPMINSTGTLYPNISFTRRMPPLLTRSS